MKIKNEKNVFKQIIVYFLFAIAMAYLEASVVVYLRQLYYPHGFAFPLKFISTKIAVIEIGREFSTLIMLVAVALLNKGGFKEKFATFAFAFAVWDLFYYFWLKVMLNWPAGLTDWDILFLIPVPWVAPWLAPAIVSLALIVASVLILLKPEKFETKILNKFEWAVEIFAGILILASFFFETGNVLQGGIPVHYPWWLFSIGYLLGVFVFVKRFKN